MLADKKRADFPVPFNLAAALEVSDQEMAESDFIFTVQRQLAEALLHRMATSGLNRKKLAEKLNIDKSTVTKMLRGNTNLTARSIAAVCWALDSEPVFSIDHHDGTGDNMPPKTEVLDPDDLRRRLKVSFS